MKALNLGTYSTAAKLSRRSFRLTTGGMAISMILLSSSALAQNGKRGGMRPPPPRIARAGQPDGVIRLPTQEKAFNPTLLKYADRKAIPFKPFDRSDPKTGKPLASDGIIKLPNGKAVSAVQYFSEIDQVERSLNTHGYSLRTLDESKATTIATIPVDESAIKAQLDRAPAATGLPRQVDFDRNFNLDALNTTSPIALNEATALKLGIPAKLLTPEVLANGRKVAAANLVGTLRGGGIVIGPMTAVQLGPWAQNMQIAFTCSPFNKSKNWAWPAGDPNILAVNITGSIGYDGVACSTPPPNTAPDTQTRFTVTAEGNVDGSVFGNTQNLLHVNGSVAGDRGTNHITATLGVIVLGQTIASVNQSYNAHWSASNTVSRGVDFSTGFYIPIGPFSIHATVGMQGQAGYQYALDVYPTAVGFSATPTVKATGYAQAGVNLLVAEAGAGANFTLVDWKMNAQASAGIGWYYGALAYGNVYADSKTDLLTGNVYAYVKYWTGCGWFCVHQVQTNYDLFSWGGYHYNSVLFDEHVLIPL